MHENLHVVFILLLAKSQLINPVSVVILIICIAACSKVNGVDSLMLI